MRHTKKHARTPIKSSTALKHQEVRYMGLVTDKTAQNGLKAFFNAHPTVRKVTGWVLAIALTIALFRLVGYLIVDSFI